MTRRELIKQWELNPHSLDEPIVIDLWEHSDIADRLTGAWGITFPNVDSIPTGLIKRILGHMEDCYDANQGYSWDIVDSAYDYIKEN